jgi:phage terminase large subunit
MSEANAQFPVKMASLFDKARYKIYYGGRGAGKSHSVAKALLIMGARSPIRVLCAREYQTSIKDSVHKLLCDQIELMNMHSIYEVTQNSIRGKNGTGDQGGQQKSNRRLHGDIQKIRRKTMGFYNGASPGFLTPPIFA